MADSSIISDVSETLRTFVKQGLQSLMNSPGVLVHNLLNKPQPPSVTLFLYEAVEDPSARNRPRVRQPVGSHVQIRKADFTLLLRYMITPWIDNLNMPYTDQVILGRICQVLYDNAILAGPDLVGTPLQNTSETLKITLAPMTIEDRTRIWNCLQLPYRLSLNYEVRVVSISPERRVNVPVVQQAYFDHGVLEERPS